MNKLELRQLAIDLLDDAQGINEAAWIDLRNSLIAAGCTDISNAVSSAEGRFFLPEDHGIVA
jgi:hypothetical protein